MMLPLPVEMARSALRAGLVDDTPCNRFRLLAAAIVAMDRAHTNVWEVFRRIVEGRQWNLATWTQEDRASIMLAEIRFSPDRFSDKLAERLTAPTVRRPSATTLQGARDAVLKP